MAKLARKKVAGCGRRPGLLLAGLPRANCLNWRATINLIVSSRLFQSAFVAASNHSPVVVWLLLIPGLAAAITVVIEDYRAAGAFAFGCLTRLCLFSVPD